MRSRRWIVVVWACFLARLLFYSAMLPLWEGYDEWAHFSVIRRMAVHGELLVSRDAAVPRDVEASFQLAPLPWEMRGIGPTYDAYWSLSADERERRTRALRELRAEDGSGAFPAYEALQPPLYYWTMAPALWLCMRFGCGLVGQVLVLRVLSSLVASAVVPLVYLLARDAWPRSALGCAAIVALMPGLALDVARVGNDCLAVVLFTALTWLLVTLVRCSSDARSSGCSGDTPVADLKLNVNSERRQERRRGLSLAIGVALGLGLLTKAYFLAAIPVVIVVTAYYGRSILPTLIGLALPSWWYVRNLRTTGTLSGLSESVMVRRFSLGEMLRRASEIHWVKAIDSVLFSHIYFGAWSSLTVRSWMYHLFYMAILAAAVGLVRLLRRPPIVTLLAVYLSFWLAQLYNVVLLYVSKGLAGSMGWYMYAVVGAEVTLCVAGLAQLLPERSSRWIAAAGAAMFALLDLYTVHVVAVPYYTGMIRHRANGSLEALHLAAFQSVGLYGVADRLGLAGPAVLVGLWVLYLAGTLGAVMCAWRRIITS